MLGRYAFLAHQNKSSTNVQKKKFSFESLLPNSRKGVRWFLVFLLVLSIPLVFLSNFFALVSLHAIAALSRIYYRWFRVSIGIELGIFAITLTALSHGPIAAVIIGWMHFLVSRVVTREPFNIVPICLLGYTAVGFLAALLPVSNIVLLGVLMTLVYDLSTSPLFVVFLNYSVWREVLFVVTHLLFNYWVFTNFGAWGLRLVGVA